MKKKAAAIGTFDGVHRGHKAVISLLKETASLRNLEPAAITFSNHPLSVIAPEKCPPSIMPLNEKIRLLQNEGAKPLVLDFNPELRDTSARHWLLRLREEFNVEVLVMGHDTTFGCDCKCLSFDDYVRLGRELGITMIMAPLIPDISSSAIRKAISQGEIEKANIMLGHPFTISGEVVAGNRIGRSIGFPTANLHPQEGILLPANGVYEGAVRLHNGESRQAMINIGTRPTVNSSSEKNIEIHILDWEGNLYGTTLTVEFIRRLRDEKKFDSLQQLRLQLQSDRNSILNHCQSR